MICGSHFSSLDLYKSYHQLEIAPKTSASLSDNLLGPISTNACPWAYAMPPNPFSVSWTKFSGSSQHFVYVDDILVFSKTPDEHIKHLRTVFQRLEEYGLVLNRDKCFRVPTLQFLGHCISVHGIVPLPTKVQAIRDFTLPSTQRQLKRFLGMPPYRRHFHTRVTTWLPRPDVVGKENI